MKNNKKRVIVAIIATLAAAISAVAFFIKRRRAKSCYTSNGSYPAQNNYSTKSRYSAFALAATTLLCGVMIMGLSMTAYANEYDDPDTDTSTIIYVETEVTATITSDPIQISIDDFLSTDRQPNQLTPQGNMTLVDDFAGYSALDKQFITVTTRNGHFFYIIIDRAGDRHNVHFLNQVSELDLLQILAELDGYNAGAGVNPLQPSTGAGGTGTGAIGSTGTATGTTGTQGGTTSPYDPSADQTNQTYPDQAPQGNNNTGLLLMVAVIAIVGGGAYYYFKVHKKKQNGGGNTKAPTQRHDEFEFDPDEDELFSDDVGEFGGYGGDGDNDSHNTDFDNNPSADTDFGNDDFNNDDLPDFTLTDEPHNDGDFNADMRESEDK